MSKMSTTLAVLGVVAGLGVTALPLSSYAADSETQRDVPLSLTIEPILQISTSADKTGEGETGANEVVLSTDNAGDTAEYASSGFSVNVKTNNSLGYTVSIKSTESETALVSGTDKIPAETLAAGKSAWAYKVTPGDGTSSQTAWTAVTDKDVVIYTGTQLAGGINATDGIDTPVTFGATVSDTQAAGTYKGSVTFTAAAVVAEP